MSDAQAGPAAGMSDVYKRQVWFRVLMRKEIYVIMKNGIVSIVTL